MRHPLLWAAAWLDNAVSSVAGLWRGRPLIEPVLLLAPPSASASMPPPASPPPPPAPEPERIDAAAAWERMSRRITVMVDQTHRGGPVSEMNAEHGLIVRCTLFQARQMQRRFAFRLLAFPTRTLAIYSINGPGLPVLTLSDPPYQPRTPS